MIDQIVVKNFKTFLSSTIDLGLVNVFIGANGSGKSNLLEAIALLGATLSGRIDGESLKYRGARPGPSASFVAHFRERPEEPITLAASTGSIKYDVGITAGPDSGDWSIQNESLMDDMISIYSRNGSVLQVRNDSGSSEWHHISNLSRAESPLRGVLPLLGRSSDGDNDAAWTSNDYDRIIRGMDLFLGSFVRYALFSPSTLSLRGIHDESARTPLGLNGEGLSQAIAELLEGQSETLGPFDLDDVYDLIEWTNDLSANSRAQALEVAGVSSHSLRLRDRFMKQEYGSIGPLSVSEGSLYVLFLLALVSHPKAPRFFAVDNFDQSLHPRLARTLTRLICDQILADGTRQMIATRAHDMV